MVSVGIWLRLIMCTILIHGISLCQQRTRRGTDGFYPLPPATLLKDGLTFDYVVVGAGAGGCPAAARLALLGYQVLLVEAGGDPGLLNRMPAGAMALLGSNTDWQYHTIPNNISCQASRGRNCRFSRGKVLGGSTSINYMMYTRGNRRDFDFNLPGWSSADLQPYLLRYEGLQVLDRLPTSSVPYHNTTGIFKMEFFDDPDNPWHSRLFEGYEALKLPRNLDVNGVSQIGVSKVVGYVYRGERNSAARVYLAREDVQRNLKVAKNTLCTGVIIDADNVTRGVTVLPALASEPLRIFARKEVILSAGAIGTPQILMLSGIGPAEHLKEMGIPVRVDLPVGDNMSDHELPLIVVLVDRGAEILEDVVGTLSPIVDLGTYLLTRGGSLASNGLTDVNAIVNLDCYDRKLGLQNLGEECEFPDLQIVHAFIDRHLVALGKPLVQQGVNLDDATVDQLAAASVNNAFIIMSPVVLKPYSRGKVRLASRDPKVHPAISAGYLSDKRDIDQMVRSIEFIEDLMETPAFKNNNATILRLKFPGCEGLLGREYWRCYVRYMTYAVFHSVGTSELAQVVDTRLCVRGVTGLRVADASIIPFVPRGNTEALTLAIGERVADFIKEDSSSG